jgi:hypothetical protein
MRYLIITIIFIALAITGKAQENMLIKKIAGKEIIRKGYNESGDLISKQKFSISNLDSSKDYLSVKILVSLFDDKDKLTNSYTTTYVCNPGESNIILSVFPFARQNNADYIIEASSTGLKGLYNFPENVNKLSDVNLTMSVKSGLLSFFGSKNIVSLKNRSVEIKVGNYILKSDLTVDAYLWGMRVKSIRYVVIEKLDSERFIISQVFRNEDGSYFSIDY